MLSNHHKAILQYADTKAGWINFGMGNKTTEVVIDLVKDGLLAANSVNQFKLTDKRAEFTPLHPKVYKKLIKHLHIF